MCRLDNAFRLPEGWKELFDSTQRLRHTGRWTREWNERLSHQAAVRHLLPAHRTTSGAEAAAHALKNLLEARSFSLRNAPAPTCSWGLVRLHLNNQDDEGTHPAAASKCRADRWFRPTPDGSTETYATPTATLMSMTVEN